MNNDIDLVIGHLKDTIYASRSENTWVFVRKDVVRKAVKFLKDYKQAKPLIDAISDQVHETAKMFRKN